MNHPARKLPVLPILAHSFAITGRNAWPLFKGLLIGTLLLTLARIGTNAMTEGSGSEWLDYLIVPVYLLVFTLFAVTCHRIILLGPASVPAFGISGWSRREWRFLWWSLVAYFYLLLILSALAGLFAVLMMFSVTLTKPVVWLAVALGAIGASHLFARFCILFPAVAVDRPGGWAWAWRASGGNGWRLTAIVALFPLLLSVVHELLMVSLGALAESLQGGRLLGDALSGLLGLALAAIGIAALSLAFRFLEREGEGDSGVGIRSRSGR